MGAARSDDKRKEIVGDITPGLLSSIYADTSLSSDAQQGKITQVETLSATALRKSLPPAQPGAQPVEGQQVLPAERSIPDDGGQEGKCDPRERK